MTTSWALMIATHVACWIVLCVRQTWRTHASIFVSQTFAAVSSLALWWAYYSPQVSQYEYENMRMAIELACAALDCAVAWCLVRCAEKELGVAETAALLLLVCYQITKLQWHWVALPFRMPDGAYAYLTPLRKAFALSIMGCFCAMAYGESGDTSPRRITSGQSH